MRKKLSILIYSLAGGGAERVVSVLLNELKERYDITLVLMRDKIEYDIPKDTKIYFLENSNPYENGIVKLLKLPYLGWKYKRFCQKNSISVTLSFMNRPNYINVLAKLFGNRVKTIISERAMPSLQHKRGVQGRINRFLIKSLYPYADIVTANSLGNSLDLKDNFGIDEVITINNPFDIKEIEKLAKERVELKRDKFIFITIGRLDSGKNHKLMIDAMRDIDARLYIIGEGQLRKEIEHQIEILELEKKVFLLGKQSNPYKFLSKANCFVFSSDYEGFPNVLVEALACGLPIISTDCKSGPREILEPDYGILTPVGDREALKDASLLMMSDSKLRDSFNQKAKKRADCFDKSRILEKFLSIIE